MGVKIDLTNKKFGRLLVLRQANSKYNRPAWFCLCECGVTKIAGGAQLRSGNTRSCGCLHAERVSETHKGRIRSEKTKQKISESKKSIKRPPFSKEWRNSLSEAKKGNKNGYNPCLTDEDRINKRHILGYSDWVHAIFERDDYTCQCCFLRGVVLHAHHLESYNNNPTLRTTVKNGVTLCKACHKDFHHQYGYKCTKKQFKEFISIRFKKNK